MRKVCQKKNNVSSEIAVSGFLRNYIRIMNNVRGQKKKKEGKKNALKVSGMNAESRRCLGKKRTSRSGG